MSPYLFNALRTLAQLTYGWIVAHLAAWGIGLPDGVLSEAITLAVFVAVVTAALRYAESRTGNDFVSKVLRFIGRAAMVGLSARQPVYAPPANPGAVALTVGYSDGAMRGAL